MGTFDIDKITIETFILGILFLMSFFEGMASKKDRYIVSSILLAGVLACVSNSKYWVIANMLLIGVQVWLNHVVDSTWVKGVGIYRGATNEWVRATCAYEINVKRGIQYILVRLNGGKVFYYDSTQEFLENWEINPDFFELYCLLGLATSVTSSEKQTDNLIGKIKRLILPKKED